MGHLVRATALDLPGHGESAQVRAADFDDAIKLIIQAAPARAVWAGYSQGARLALAVACRFPERVAGLVLESGTAGLESADARHQRCQSDAALAHQLRTHGVSAFVATWETLPLFAGVTRLPHEEQAALRALRLSQDAEGLAHALDVMGQGTQPALWNMCNQVACPVLLVSGSDDVTYTAHAQRMAGLFPRAKHLTLPGGHVPHLEQRSRYIQALRDFMGVVEREGHEPKRPR